MTLLTDAPLDDDTSSDEETMLLGNNTCGADLALTVQGGLCSDVSPSLNNGNQQLAAADPALSDETNERVNRLYAELKKYLELLPHTPRSLNALLDAEHNCNDEKAWGLLRYYEERPNLLEYTLEKELPRMDYTWIDEVTGESITDRSRISVLLWEASLDAKKSILPRCANQSLLADLLQFLTTESDNSLIRTQFHMAVHTRQVHIIVMPSNGTVLVKAALDLSLPHFSKDEEMLHLGTVQVSAQFSPVQSPPLFHYHVESVQVASPLPNDDELLQLAHFLQDLPSFVIEEEEENEQPHQHNWPTKLDVCRDVFLQRTQTAWKHVKHTNSNLKEKLLTLRTMASASSVAAGDEADAEAARLAGDANNNLPKSLRRIREVQKATWKKQMTRLKSAAASVKKSSAEAARAVSQQMQQPPPAAEPQRAPPALVTSSTKTTTSSSSSTLGAAAALASASTHNEAESIKVAAPPPALPKQPPATPSTAAPAEPASAASASKPSPVATPKPPTAAPAKASAAGSKPSPRQQLPPLGPSAKRSQKAQPQSSNKVPTPVAKQHQLRSPKEQAKKWGGMIRSRWNRLSGRSSSSSSSFSFKRGEDGASSSEWDASSLSVSQTTLLAEDGADLVRDDDDAPTEPPSDDEGTAEQPPPVSSTANLAKPVLVVQTSVSTISSSVSSLATPTPSAPEEVSPSSAVVTTNATCSTAEEEEDYDEDETETELGGWDDNNLLLQGVDVWNDRSDNPSAASPASATGITPLKELNAEWNHPTSTRSCPAPASTFTPSNNNNKRRWAGARPRRFPQLLNKLMK